MPTKKPRLTITISEPLAWQLQKLSQLTGQSQGGLIASLLEGSDIVLQRLIIVLEAAEQARHDMPGHLVHEMTVAQERIERHFGLVDAVDSNVKRRARKSGQRGPDFGDPGRPSAQGSNPLSNRGVRSKAKEAKSSTGSRS